MTMLAAGLVATVIAADIVRPVGRKILPAVAGISAIHIMPCHGYRHSSRWRAVWD